MDTTAHTSASCLADLHALIALYDDMRTHLDDGNDGPAIDTKPLDNWHTKASTLTQSKALETLTGERKLEALIMELRHLWLQAVHSRSSRYMMSPPQTQIKYLPGGDRVNYPYDRWLKPINLENRLAGAWPTPKGWHKQSLLFASAMAAITTFLQAYRGLAPQWWTELSAPQTLHWWGGYFEISKALQLVCDQRFIGRKHATQDGLHKHMQDGQTDLIVLEPVAAKLELDVFDLDSFVAAWSKRKSKRPATLLIDTSLLGDTISMEDFCKRLNDQAPALIVEVRSGLKLDQQGLELANAGLMNLWMPEHRDDKLDDIVNSLQISRTTLGTNLSHNELAALQAPLFLHADLLNTHTTAVFAANRLFAEQLHPLIKPDTGVFDAVFHPSLGDNARLPWAQSPFVNIRYRPDDDSARSFLNNVLDFESHRRKLCFWPASSFGFRSHRYEMGYGRDIKFNTLRVALGARHGPSMHEVIKLFQELARFSDFQDLRNAYPEVSTRMTPDQRDNDD
ncbi:hypothetical protein V5T82_01030 [Magnetovibrio sp. PR-2]|uniref:hypothetical protein n=1 Tax=Magnetovibrio sp. PR-2 TaxID=3120356 RepID=UPI002FCE2A88